MRILFFKGKQQNYLTEKKPLKTTLYLFIQSRVNTVHLYDFRNRKWKTLYTKPSSQTKAVLY